MSAVIDYKQTDFTEWDIPEDIGDTDVVDAEFPTIDYCLAAGSKGVDITNEDYHALPGISGSNLTLLAESNKHLDNKHLFFTSTSALTFGSLLHTMVLEPHDVENRYVVMPEFDLRTNVGKANKSQFIEDNKGKTIIEKESFETAKRMSRNVRVICGDIIEKGIKERSLFVKIDGLILKSRLDIDLEDVGDDYDLKSITLGIKEFSDATLEAHIKKFKYHWSAAFRNIIRRELGKPVRDSYLIFVNTGPGHMVRVIKMRPLWIKEAEAVVQDLLDARRFYLASKIDIPAVEIDDRNRKLIEY
jgi:hypothetical protein